MRIHSIQLKDRNGIWCSHTCFFLSETAVAHLQHKDLSLVDADAWSQAMADRQEGFCHQRFKPNLTILNSSEEPCIESGHELGIRNARLFVLEKRHHCHQECPMINLAEKNCSWTQTIRYVRVISEGNICVNDPIQLLRAQIDP
jgi:MOSC domain-containing protein YiiM